VSRLPLSLTDRREKGKRGGLIIPSAVLPWREDKGESGEKGGTMPLYSFPNLEGTKRGGKGGASSIIPILVTGWGGMREGNSLLL